MNHKINQTYPKIRESVTPISGDQIISHRSFTHITELLRCEDATKRAFYEVECMRGNWSVRELKRQIIEEQIKDEVLRMKEKHKRQNND